METAPPTEPRAERAVIDTNVFVAAGFRPGGASARILAAVRAGRLVMLWTDATRRETRAVVGRIPPLSWQSVAGLFLEAGRISPAPDPAAAAFVADPEDRKFAALALATGAEIVSSDSDLLDHAGRLRVVTPAAFAAARPGLDAGAGPP
jgi:predicted nucleic acid-binding protein